MAQNRDEKPDPKPGSQTDGQLRALMALFNWLVGEVVTARVMILRLAADLVRTGTLPVDEINGMPLAQEIIDSVMSNFPSDPMWQVLEQRLRNSLETLRRQDLRDNDDPELDDAEDDDDDLDYSLDDDDLDDLDDLEIGDIDESEIGREAQVEVIYRNPDHHFALPEALLLPRFLQKSGRHQN